MTQEKVAYSNSICYNKKKLNKKWYVLTSYREFASV